MPIYFYGAHNFAWIKPISLCFRILSLLFIFVIIAQEILKEINMKFCIALLKNIFVDEINMKFCVVLENIFSKIKFTIQFVAFF